MKFFKCLVLSVIVYFGLWIMSATSHSGVENEIVKARMMSMKKIAASMKYIGKVQRGAQPFDPNEIKKNLETIKYNASITPKLFEQYAVDPLSEAGIEIWETFDDFKTKALQLEKTADELLNTVENKEQLKEALRGLGSNCKSCHSKYRN